ncbi:MAG: hypothetical protein ACYSR9_05405, partial [Planctomycetota bacterium]
RPRTGVTPFPIRCGPRAAKRRDHSPNRIGCDDGPTCRFGQVTRCKASCTRKGSSLLLAFDEKTLRYSLGEKHT